MKQKYRAQKTLRASPELSGAPSSALVIYGRGSGPVMKLHPLVPSLAPSGRKTHSRNYYATLCTLRAAQVTSYANVYFLPSITMIKRGPVIEASNSRGRG